MAADSQQVTGPDGHVWTLTIDRERGRAKDTVQEDAPFHAAFVIATIAIVAFFIWIIHAHGIGVFAILGVTMFIVWVVGVIGSSYRPTIEATTPGPPPEHRKWTVTKRRHGEQALADIGHALGQGENSAEPDGTRLTEI
jgi:hypothetical protein